jgi:hypothetical protein
MSSLNCPQQRKELAQGDRRDAPPIFLPFMLSLDDGKQRGALKESWDANPIGSG